MNRKFPLQGLLRARVLQEEQAAAALATANYARTQAETAVAHARRQLADLAFPESGVRSDGLSTRATVSWSAMVAARAASIARVQDLTQAVDYAQTEAEAATDVWKDARRNASAIGKLDEKHQEAVALEDLRDEQRLLDEAAIRGARGGNDDR